MDKKSVEIVELYNK